jgi:hypothetical protein
VLNAIHLTYEVRVLDLELKLQDGRWGQGKRLGDEGRTGSFFLFVPGKLFGPGSYYDLRLKAFFS